MKKLLLSIFFLSVLKIVNAQYHPMIADSGKWNILLESYNFQNGNSKMTAHFSYNTDTLIGTHHYKKIDNKQFLREDTVLKIVYLYKPNSDSILYNFNLNLSDSFYFNCQSSLTDGWHKISKIDTVQTLAGLRRRIIFSNGADVWIEGIGSMHGPIYGLYISLSHSIGVGGAHTVCSLLCAEQNHLQTYQNSSFNTCDINEPSGLYSLSVSTIIAIFPNPTSTHFTIKKNSTENLQFQLYNLFGQNVLSKNLVDESTMLNRNQLSNGIYFYKITNSKAEVKSSGKIVFE